MSHFAAKFAWRTDIDQRFPMLHVRQRIFVECANLFIATARNRIFRLWKLRLLTGHLPPFSNPFLASAIKNFHLFMAEESEGPERITSPPIGFIAVKDASRIGCDPVPAAKIGKGFGSDIVAN